MGGMTARPEGAEILGDRKEIGGRDFLLSSALTVSTVFGSKSSRWPCGEEFFGLDAVVSFDGLAVGDEWSASAWGDSVTARLGASAIGASVFPVWGDAPPSASVLVEVVVAVAVVVGVVG